MNVSRSSTNIVADRRKGLDRIVAAVRAANPRWSDFRVLTEAKSLWHQHMDPNRVTASTAEAQNDRLHICNSGGKVRGN